MRHKRRALTGVLAAMVLGAGLAPPALADNLPDQEAKSRSGSHEERKPKVDISFSEPQLAAPPPAYGPHNPPRVAQRNTGGGPAGARESKKMKCAKEDGRKRTVCIRIGRDRNGNTDVGAATKKRLKAASHVPWCDAQPVGKAYMTRTEACLKDITPISLFYMYDGKEIGWADFAMQQEIQLHGNQDEFDQYMTLVPTRIDRNLGTVQMKWWATDDCTDCTKSQQRWRGEPLWTGPEDRHTARGLYQTKWNGKGREDVLLNWELGGRISRYPLEVYEDLGTTDPDLEIRCDSEVAESAGCVFPKYRPTYPFNSKKYPAAAAHAWLMKEKLPNHPGSKKYGRPLSYLPEDNKHGRDPDDNRAVICRPYKYHPDTALVTAADPTDRPSCDELAFAATYQSGGMPASMGGTNPVASGDQCVQTVATRLRYGKWKLYDDDRYAAPTWKEVCGRSSMSRWMNSGSMGRFSSFAATFRMMDEDQYWIDTPGFEHCRSDRPTVTCRFAG